MIIFAKPCSCILLLLLAGCGAFVPTPQPTPTLVPEEQDQSWLTDQPCQTPCWYGLEPGVSSLDQVLATVGELPFIDPESKREFESQAFSNRLEDRINATIITYDCLANTEIICAAFDFVDDTLFSITISSNLPITIEEVISQIGAPDLLRYS